MAVLNITPRQRMVDQQGRPYFLWDMELTLEAFEERLRDPDPDVRAYFMGKLMREARPDDVFGFVSLAEITEHWPSLERYLGRTRGFWTWLLASWEAMAHDRQPA